MDRRLLEHYNTELRHLREMAGEFAREYPKIAGRLALDPFGKETCPDPHVERLLEGFAWLAARVHLQLDAEFPRFTQSLLEIVSPQFLAPTPSMSIVRLEPDPRDEALAKGVMLPRGTRLKSQRNRGEATSCIFTTAHEVKLLPVQISSARYFTRNLAELELPTNVKAKAALRLRLSSTGGMPFSAINLDPIQVHLNGSDEIPYLLYEQLIGHASAILIQTQRAGERPVTRGVFSPEGVRRKGFTAEEAMLPSTPRGFDGYRLLREYFALPQRFLFVELGGFQKALASCETMSVDVTVLFDTVESRLENRFDATSFELFCTPVINLFSRRLDRILVNDRVSELYVCPDQNRPLDYEVFELEKVLGYGPDIPQAREFKPFYFARNGTAPTEAFFTTRRVTRMPTKEEEYFYKHHNKRASCAGTDIYLSLVDNTNTPVGTSIRQLGMEALCTNRHLPTAMAIGAGSTDFSLEVCAPVNAVRCLLHPTDPLPSMAEGQFAWRLISHLSLNHLSLLEGKGGNGPVALREMLELYCPEGERMAIGRRQIEGLRDIKSKTVLQRVHTPGPICFARGLDVTLTFDEACFEGAGVFLFGGVLEYFLGKYVTINSFTETVIATLQRGELIRWPARTGQKGIL